MKEPQSDPASPTRLLSVEEATRVPAGGEHYRSYVGPADRFDFMSATQFALLFSLGLRDHHRVLDFGCGSLRLGRLLIPFLQERRYFGIDPNQWLIDDALDRELGRDIISIKKPSFSNNSNFETTVFGEKFDFIIAQSILTHTGPDLVQDFLRSAVNSLAPSGLLLYSYIKEEGTDLALPDRGWHYPACVPFREEWMLRELRQVGLFGRPLPWFHPSAAWLAAGHSHDELPSQDQLDLLTGAVLRVPQFAASIKRPTTPAA